MKVRLDEIDQRRDGTTQALKQPKSFSVSRVCYLRSFESSELNESLDEFLDTDKENHCCCVLTTPHFSTGHLAIGIALIYAKLTLKSCFLSHFEDSSN